MDAEFLNEKGCRFWEEPVGAIRPESFSQGSPAIVNRMNVL
jgi:hypothetical protein